MSSPYVGEIRIFGGNFAPAGWAFCNGQSMAIAENDVLFTLIGTTYGGDGVNTFNLPDLRSRLPLHEGPNNVIGQSAGVESVTLTVPQAPSHAPALLATGDAATGTAPANKVLAASTGATVSPYGTDAPTTVLNPQSVAPAGGSQPHTNIQPYLAISLIISLFGVFPTRN